MLCSILLATTLSTFAPQSPATHAQRLPLVQRVNRQNPPGSYYKTCNACDWSGGLFVCKCDRIDGVPNWTAIDYNYRCPGHTLQNINGELKCD